ncbi:MAG: hypothetical protein ACUVQP_11580 [Bacteroidales bacterium]
MKKTILFWVYFFNIYFTIAQEDTIWFLSGERLITSQYSVNLEEGILTYMNKHNKKKQVGLEYIFSIIDSKNNEKVFFEPATIGNTYFTIEQMRSFIQGEYLARKTFHAPVATVSSILIGTGSFYAVPSVIGLNVLFSPLLPAANVAIIGSFNYKDDKVIKKFPDKKDDAYFIAGYKEIATQKRINNSIKGGLIGLGIGLASAIIIHQIIK